MISATIIGHLDVTHQRKLNDFIMIRAVSSKPDARLGLAAMDSDVHLSQ